jgi:hypothetical protein
MLVYGWPSETERWSLDVDGLSSRSRVKIQSARSGNRAEKSTPGLALRTATKLLHKWSQNKNKNHKNMCRPIKIIH